MSNDEIRVMGSYKFTTYGILVRDDRGKSVQDPVIAVAAEQGEDGRYRGVTFIPAGMVYDVRDLGPLNVKRKARRRTQTKIESREKQEIPTEQPDSNKEQSV